MEIHHDERGHVDPRALAMSTIRSSLDEQLETVESREDFVAFLEALVSDLHTHREDWENATLEGYLDALSAWAGDMAGYFRNRGETVPESPSWRLLATMLRAARDYE